jgi:hypothetical protein
MLVFLSWFLFEGLEHDGHRHCILGFHSTKTGRDAVGHVGCCPDPEAYFCPVGFITFRVAVTPFLRGPWNLSFSLGSRIGVGHETFSSGCTSIGLRAGSTRSAGGATSDTVLDAIRIDTLLLGCTVALGFMM